MPCMGPSIPPCFDVPEGTKVIALEFDKDGAKIIFLDINGKVINIDNSPVITAEVKMEIALSGSMESRKDVSLDATFNFVVKNGCDVPEAYKEEILSSF